MVKITFFHRILWDHALDEENGFIKLKESSKIKKVILCSGKVYFDLLEAREKLKKDDVVLYRVEQLYPFPVKSLVREIKKYAKNAKFYWCQEEPKNMGAWFSVRDYIQWTLETINANNTGNFLYRKKPRRISCNRVMQKDIFHNNKKLLTRFLNKNE